MSRVSIKKANKAYEDWLRQQLKGELIVADLKAKRKKMIKKGPFGFLRGTYWRWAETILQLCPDPGQGPSVLAVGDIHLENYGSWRDQEGRLIWGINDFDEAADMPYAFDLARLATSALLAQQRQVLSPDKICAAILEGYRNGLEAPKAFVLDQRHTWLFQRLTVSPNDRKDFWDDMKGLDSASELPAGRYRTAIDRAMPAEGLAITFAPRTGGLGSLGRPRWVGMADWHGGRVVREAKALVPSAWTRVFPPKWAKQQVGAIAAGHYRPPDPWYRVRNDVVVRRLSPNNRKIEVKDDEKAATLLDLPLLRAMGHELANVHHGVTDKRELVRKDLAKQKSHWLLDNATIAKDLVESEFNEWKKP